MEIRFAYIFKISHNNRNFLFSPLTWFKLQGLDLVFTWINQLNLFALCDTFEDEDTKEPMSKNRFFLHSFFLIRPFLRVFLFTNIEKHENQSNKKSY